MKENQILAVIKEPGKAPRLDPLFENSLEAFQAVVGGCIETVTFSEDIVIICNEEGRLKGLPFNVEIGGVGFVGTILAVSMKGDEFASVRASMIPKVLQIMGGRN
jgi:hypothetical protein